MKILVLGVGGMAGHVIAMYMSESGHDVTGLARKKHSFCTTIVTDAMDTQAVKNALIGDYDAVINCIGILNKAVNMNPFKGIYLNGCLPHLLAMFTKGTRTKIVQLSTDCVFSGHDNGGYIENSFRSSDTLYGRSKALGEIDDDKNLTFRMSIVGPDCNKDGVGLFNWFMRQETSVTGYTNVVWTGVSTIVLARALESALAQGLTGVYHLVNGEAISKYNLLRLFNCLREKPVEIHPSSIPKEDKSLTNTRTDFDFYIPPYEDMLREIGTWVNRRRTLYPHYIVKEYL
jgi:dTDP-4-dehydrorhamnose reductase